MQYAKPVTLKVDECDRLSFLPYLVGNDFLYAEAYVYALAQKMMPEYQGGFWHFIRLPDGGGYAVGSENGGDGDAFVREEREAMDVVLQALDGEHMS